VLLIIDEEKLIQFLGQIGKLRVLPLFTTASPLCNEYGFSEEHIIALAKIVMMDDPFVSYIASALYITTSKASRLVRYLEEIKLPDGSKAQLVQRKYGEAGDRRKIKLEPTKEGVELFEKMWADLAKFLGEIMKDLGEENVAQLVSLMQQFNDIAEEKIKELLNPTDCPETTESCDE